MKLRLTGHAVRLRMRRSEVEKLAAGSSIAETVVFPGGATLTFRVSGAAVGEPAVAFSGSVVDVVVPRETAVSWPDSQQVGIYGKQQSLEILVEKDFRRTSLPSPDDDDRYPNPRAHAREASGPHS
ncbi:MAG: hypothetical protein SFV54_27280 [Bryobacteraceae bacterium]|nr:hypothetical protein [Bryobacteraceae bacterium]